MRSNRAHFLSGHGLRSGLRTQAIISRKSGTHCADLRAEPACAKQNGYCCARPLRKFYASYPLYSLVVRPLRDPKLRAEPEGGQVAGATPPFAHSTRHRTPVALRITRVRCLPPYGGVAPATMIPAGRLGFRRPIRGRGEGVCKAPSAHITQ